PAQSTATPPNHTLSLHDALPISEEPLRNACVPGMSVAENMTLRNFDRPPQSSGPWLRRGALRAQAERWIRAFGVKTEGPDAPMADRKSTRLNSSHVSISYAVFCL